MRPGGSARPTGCWPSSRAIDGATPICMHQLSIRARRRGDGDEARSRLAAVVALRPDVPVAGDRARAPARGRGRAARALATLTRAGGRGCPTSRRRWWRWASCCTGMGKARRGAGAAAHGAGVAAAGSGAEALPRSSGRRRATAISASPDELAPPLRRGRADVVAAARARRRRRPDRERRGRAARSPRGARAPQRAVADVRPARRPGADRTRRRGEQGVRRPLHAGPRRGRYPPGARLPARTRAAS